MLLEHTKVSHERSSGKHHRKPLHQSFSLSLRLFLLITDAIYVLLAAHDKACLGLAQNKLQLNLKKT